MDIAGNTLQNRYFRAQTPNYPILGVFGPNHPNSRPILTTRYFGICSHMTWHAWHDVMLMHRKYSISDAFQMAWASKYTTWRYLDVSRNSIFLLLCCTQYSICYIWYTQNTICQHEIHVSTISREICGSSISRVYQLISWCQGWYVSATWWNHVFANCINIMKPRGQHEIHDSGAYTEHTCDVHST